MSISVFLILLIALFQGCAESTRPKVTTLSRAEQNYLKEKPANLQPFYRQLLEGGERNRVLNLMRLGLNAMQLGYTEDAKKAFDEALYGIERVYSNDEHAMKALSVWVEEGRKDFKGEPYERVMAYYYRGLLYILDKDYQTARACFEGGMAQDAFAFEEQYRCDFALMSFLSGWCSQRLNDEILCREAFKELKRLRPDIALPKKDDNLLLIIETGKSPRKVADGVGHYQLKFRRGRHFLEKKAEFEIDNGEFRPAYPLEDIYWQASTRGGRQFDYILNGKAKFKRQAAIVGSALSPVASQAMIASTVFNNSASELQGIGVGVGVISVISQLASAKARPEADIRYWDNLPDAVHVATCKLEPGKHKINVKFFDQNGVLLENLTKSVEVEMPRVGSKLVWLRSRRQISCKYEP